MYIRKHSLHVKISTRKFKHIYAIQKSSNVAKIFYNTNNDIIKANNNEYELYCKLINTKLFIAK